MDGGQMCFLEKSATWWKAVKGLKNCFRVALWKLIWFGDKFCKKLTTKFVKNNKLAHGKSLKSIWITYKYQANVFKGHLKAMLINETSWDCIML